MAAHYPTVVSVSTIDSNAASITHNIGGTLGGANVTKNPGDLIMVFLESANQAFTAPVGGGYTQLTANGTGTAGAAAATRLTIFYKISNGTETTYVTGDSGDHQTVFSLIIRYVDRENPINVSAGAAVAAPPVATATITWSAVTPTRPECMIINAAAFDRDANLNPYITAGNEPTNANLTNITSRVNRTFNTGSGGGLGVWTAEKSTNTTTGSSTATQPTALAYVHHTIAIAPLRRRIAVT
jgi:hypothetical protein